MSGPPEADNSSLLSQIAPVSRETREKLELFIDLLRKWQKTQSLVSPESLKQVWQRHVADSLQLIDLGFSHGPWIDLGSGAGFPGLVIAIAGQGRAGHHVDLIEANQGKCAFLREAIRLTGAPASVHCARIENVVDIMPKGQKTITARALAPLKELCGLVAPLMGEGTVALFPKGRIVEDELVEAKRFWALDYEKIPSKTDPDAAILRITGLKKV